ncbi:DUF86 domain-containing protein [Candidatus Micrarchaeota archaeon]|nr:DUF86 domain-containing protein [Candidatus Micrarchaeota archaeon]
MRNEILLKMISEHIEKVKAYRKKYEESKSEETLDALAMNCFQVVNYLIDLGEAAAIKNKTFYSPTYRELFEELRDKKIITDEELKVVSALVSLRNKIAHEYHVIKKEDVKLMALYASKLDSVIKKMSKALR